MKSVKLLCVSAMTGFGLLAMPLGIAAQQKQENQQQHSPITVTDNSESRPEPSPSCSQGTDGQFGADHAQSEATTFVGHCQRNGDTGHNLTGNCTGHYLNQPICLSISDAHQCPPGAKAIKPGFIGCGSEHFLPVDSARSCSH
jgi:hypothetical protein